MGAVQGNLKRLLTVMLKGHDFLKSHRLSIFGLFPEKNVLLDGSVNIDEIILLHSDNLERLLRPALHNEFCPVISHKHVIGLAFFFFVFFFAQCGQNTGHTEGKCAQLLETWGE